MTELSIYAKLINSIYKSINDGRIDLPVNYGNYDGRYIALSDNDDMVIANFNKAGISRQAILNMVSELENDWKINMSGFGIMYDGKLVYEHYPDYNKPASRHVSFSVSKSIVAMALGIAVEQGLIRPDERLVDIFPAHDGIFIKRGMKDVTIYHLLTMTAGVKFDELNAYFSSGWRNAFMGSELAFEPGSDFSYNSINTYMLSAAIQKKSGMHFRDFIEKYLFAPMNITDVTWDMCPEGFVLGGWGMKLSIRDMLKLGQLYINDGTWLCDGELKQLVPKGWLAESVRCHYEFQDNDIIKGYGYHIWLLKDGSYLFNGVFGQNVYINPDRALVIAVTASAYAFFPDCDIVKTFCSFASDDDNFKKDKMLAGLMHSFKERRTKKMSVSYAGIDIVREYMGNEYCFNEYSSSVVPLTTQFFYSNFMSSIKSVCFDIIDDALLLRIKDEDNSYDIMLGLKKGVYIQRNIIVKEKEYRISAHCDVFTKNNGQPSLYVYLYFPEETTHKYMEFTFDDDELLMSVNELPDIRKFVNIMSGDKRMLRTKKLDIVRIPGYIEYKLQKLVSPRVTGYRIK